MYVLELAVQGVRGFASSARVPLKPGYQVLKPSGREPPPLAALFVSLCYNDARGTDAQFAATGERASKAGVTLYGNDQGTYRIVRELGGPGALHRLDKASNRFEVLSQDAAEIGQFLRSQVGVPSKAALEQIFCLHSAQLPTRRPKGQPKPPSSAPRSALASHAPVVADASSLEAKLAELKREHALSKEVDQLQFQLDGIAQQLFELESKVKSTDGLKEAIREAEENAARSPTIESMGLPKDIISRAERYATLVQKRDEALIRIQAEREEAEGRASGPVRVEPPFRDVRFVGGIAAGVVFFGLGMFLSGDARYVALLDIPAFGLAALAALKWVDDLQAATAVSRKGDYLAMREKKVMDEFEAETGQVRAAMAKAGVETPEQLIEFLSRRPLLLERVAELKQQLADHEKDPDYASAAARYAQLKAEQERINARLLEKGGYVRDVREVERDIARTEEAIARAKNPQPASEPTFSAVPTGPAEVYEDPTPPVMLLAADLFGADVVATAAQLKDRCGQYLAALTDKRYHGVEFDKDGRAFAVAPGRRVPVGELAGPDLDIYYLSLRFTVIEKLSARAKVPFFIEDSLAFVDAAEHGLLGRMLKHLGTLTQLLHVADGTGASAAADAIVAV